MKVKFDVVLDGNLKLPLSCKMDSLKDVASLGTKMVSMARNAKRLFPDLAALPVKSVKISTE